MACGHLKTFFGVKGNGVSSNEEADGFYRFQLALTKLGYRVRGPLFTTTAALCDHIVKLAAELFPELNVADFDTPVWHRSVRQDFADHADDAHDTQWTQLWRNLPSVMARPFIDDTAILGKIRARGRGTVTHAQSETMIDRSRLNTLPIELQFLLLTDLPAYSVFALTQTLSEEVQIKAMLYLVERDVLRPMSTFPTNIALSGPLLSIRDAHYELQNPKTLPPTFRQVQEFYKNVTREVTRIILDEMAEFISPSGMFRPSLADRITFVGHSFRLSLIQNDLIYLKPAEPVTVFQDILGPLFREPIQNNLYNLKDRKTMHTIVQTMVSKIDLGICMEFHFDLNGLGVAVDDFGRTTFKPSRNTAFYWPAKNGKTVLAPPTMLTLGPTTLFRITFDRSDAPLDNVELSDEPPTPVEERWPIRYG